MRIFTEDTFTAKDVNLMQPGDRVQMNFDVKKVRVREDGEKVFVLELHCGLYGEDSLLFEWTPEGLMLGSDEM